MNYVYPAIFFKEEGQVIVEFPDIPDLATFGDDIGDALSMAQDALGLYLFTALRDGDKLNAPSAIDTIKPERDDALVNLVCVDLDAFAKAYSDKAVKKTLSIPAWLNTACENAGINYSKVLKDALVARLQAQN